MNKKSIAIIGKSVDSAYVIKDINVDEVNLEKYNVNCRSDIESAWENTETGSKEKEGEEREMEVVLQEKISNINLAAKPEVVEIATKNSGKIIKDFVIDKPKRGKKVYLSELIFFKEPGDEILDIGHEEVVKKIQ